MLAIPILSIAITPLIIAFLLYFGILEYLNSRKD